MNQKAWMNYWGQPNPWLQYYNIIIYKIPPFHLPANYIRACNIQYHWAREESKVLCPQTHSNLPLVWKGHFYVEKHISWQTRSSLNWHSLVVETTKLGVHDWGFELGSDYNAPFSPESFYTFPSLSFLILKVGSARGLSKELWFKVAHTVTKTAGRETLLSVLPNSLHAQSSAQFCHLQNRGEKMLPKSHREKTSKRWKKPDVFVRDRNRSSYSESR